MLGHINEDNLILNKAKTEVGSVILDWFVEDYMS